MYVHLVCGGCAVRGPRAVIGTLTLVDAFQLCCKLMPFHSPNDFYNVHHLTMFITPTRREERLGEGKYVNVDIYCGSYYFVF